MEANMLRLNCLLAACVLALAINVGAAEAALVAGMALVASMLLLAGMVAAIVAVTLAAMASVPMAVATMASVPMALPTIPMSRLVACQNPNRSERPML